MRQPVQQSSPYHFRHHDPMGFTQWVERVRETFGPLEIKAPNPGSFRASARTASLGEIMLLDMRTPAHSVSREPEPSEQVQGGYCKLSLQLEGQSQVSQDGRRCTLNPGDLALYITKRPYRLDYTGPQRSLVVLFPQSFVHLSPEYTDLITATPVSESQGLGKFAVPLFEQLATNLEELGGPHALALVRSALEMVITVMIAESTQAGRQPAHTIYHRAVAYIEEHLDDPDLGPSKIAEALYISLRQLHSRFSAHQQTVSAFIRVRRLERIREDLANPRYRAESVQAISARYALFDPSYVSKAFKTQYGLSPSAYRSQILG
ncbi:helix-turn-helix domain-containing protein [Rothia sp. CCM 9416]|uniref:AraC-like ligand-binding domain-containing protein n=1 Tax=Rothia sp. CCM 9416 TaxID=3402655 RepID=UPI003AE6699B